MTHCELFNSFNCLLPRKVEGIGVIDGIKKLHEFYASDPLVADLATTKAELKLSSTSESITAVATKFSGSVVCLRLSDLS